MQKREIAWVVVLLLLIGAYIVFFSNWGQKREIRVVASIRPSLPMGRRRGGAPAVTNALPYRVIFELDGSYKLTGLELTEVDTQHTNAAEHVLWHMVSKSNSLPVKVFQYGQPIKGLEPDIEGVQPEPLAPGGIYRMEVSTRSLKGASPPFMIPAAPK
jgi:hypothetical protein